VEGFTVSVVEGIVVPSCPVFPFCGAVVVSVVDSILFVVYTLAKLSFSPYDRDQTLEV
jgi:hypothetical protein